MATTELATFGGGCFWCTEAVFQQLRGVHSVVSGYCGGETPNPTYKEVCSGGTGHAEVIQVEFDPSEISYRDLLDVFFATHDPTTLNRQGNDVGTQYRSVIFPHNDEQRRVAEEAIREQNASGEFRAPIVTTIEPYQEFFPGEGYHQNYFVDNPRLPYCAVVIAPKVEKFRKKFGGKLAEM
jgi:peptide-methionine (S)-S-oxide reductase